MRRVARVDGNQKKIAEIFRKAGASVACTHQLGHGFPDLVVGFNGRTILIEVKDGDKAPSARQLTEDERKFHSQWQGAIAVVAHESEVLDVLATLLE